MNDTAPNGKSSTPGPWTTRDTHDNSTEISSEHFSGRVLATVHAPMVTNSENAHEETANARLIAAAPDLLERLTWAVRWLNAYEGECMPQWRAWQTDAAAAIARATGEQP